MPLLFKSTTQTFLVSSKIVLTSIRIHLFQDTGTECDHIMTLSSCMTLPSFFFGFHAVSPFILSLTWIFFRVGSTLQSNGFPEYGPGPVDVPAHIVAAVAQIR